MSRKHTGLWIGWALCFAIGALSTFVFVGGVLRDSNFGESRIAVDLSTPSETGETGFRIWGGGPYAVFLTTLHTASRPEDYVAPGEAPRFDGRIAVRVTDPSGAVRLEREAGADLNHSRPYNVEFSEIGEFEAEGGPWREWTLAARVLEGGESFALDPLRSHVIVRKRRDDPGMGGLINYAFMFPAILFGGLALFLGWRLARAGASRVPVVLSGAMMLPLLLLLL